MSNTLVKLLGWKATILHGDPAVVDRWKWLRRHLRGGAVDTFDAGCGSGAFTLYAASVGNRAVGMSFDEANQRKAEERARILGLPGARFVVGDLRALRDYPQALGPFDQVICCETIEHILDDGRLVADLAALLRPGGRLLLTTPYRHYRPLRGDRVSEVEDGGHVRWGYTHDELRALFAPHGLEVVAEEYVTGAVTQKLMNLMRRIGEVDARAAWAITFPLRLLRVLDRPVTALTRYPALSVASVAVKRR
ncbi:MAG: class I SAM-dependent methyltransferase [Gemmatimonadetes bacterium]|nr:class I SAM-dependent methyltransferase [Gemmatimonadota bacterium]